LVTSFLQLLLIQQDPRLLAKRTASGEYPLQGDVHTLQMAGSGGVTTINLPLLADCRFATTANLASPELWRLSVAGDLIAVLCAMPLLWMQ
jgi:hypothetical protein